MNILLRLGMIAALVLCLAFGCYAETITKVVPVKYRSAEELVPVLSSLIGEKGRVSAYEQSLVISIPEKDFAAIEDVLRQLDRKRENLRISVRQGVRKAQLGESSAVGEMDFDRFAYRLGNLTKSTEQSILLAEGETALLTVGREVPFTRHMAIVAGKHAGISKTIEFKKVATGFWVRPFLQEDKILLEVKPHMASWQNEKRALNFQSLATKVVIPLGKWYRLSEHLESSNEINRAILVWKAGEGTNMRDVWVKVEKQSFDLDEGN